jgi:hypothetical protein
VNADYISRWQRNRRTEEAIRDEEARQMREHFERELALSANCAQYEVLYALGEVDLYTPRGVE